MRSCIRSSSIYKEFMTLCKSGDTAAVQLYHDMHLKNLNTPELYSLNHNLDPNLYQRLMVTVRQDVGADASVPPAVLYWFSMKAAADKNIQLK